jgi:2,3-bisphosphoglycerate-dependent phosphoglycerate mutase
MNDIVEVALIRHGLPNRIEGVTKPDPGLTSRGFEQARAVAEAMAFLPVRTVASSGLQRALQTAGPTAEKLGMTVQIDDDLAEFNNGEDYYIPIEDMVAENDPRLDRWRELAVDPSMVGVLAQFQQRVTAAVHRVAAATPAGTAAVFCHGGVIGACIEKALGGVRLPMTEPHYGSITRIMVEPHGEWKLRSLNEIHHIERFSARQGESE